MPADRLDDGAYDVIVVDVREEGAPEGPWAQLDVAVLAGAHKGEVVSVRASGIAGDPLDWLGVPGTLTVADGEPSIVLER